MPGDTFSATWVSHSSISDFLACPRAYYLKNVYRNPKTGHKISLASPPLSLGHAVHAVLESISTLPTEKRFVTPLPNLLENEWKSIAGKRGGFLRDDSEQQYKQRARDMLVRVMKNPGPLKNRAIKIQQEHGLPRWYLSEDDNIILCGKIDWLEYLDEYDAVHIIDFKTGRSEEDPTSLQLPIYHLLVHHCQSQPARPVKKASYWYLDRDDGLVEKDLPPINTARDDVLKVARRITLARKLSKFACPHNGCRACTPLEKIINGEAEFVGMDKYNHDTYIIPEKDTGEKSIIL